MWGARGGGGECHGRGRFAEEIGKGGGGHYEDSVSFMVARSRYCL